MYIPLTFNDFSLISKVFIYIHKYVNLILCISEPRINFLCLKIKLVPSLKFKMSCCRDTSTFVRTSPFFRSALCVAVETMQFQKLKNVYPLGKCFYPFRWFQNNLTPIKSFPDGARLI